MECDAAWWEHVARYSREKTVELTTGGKWLNDLKLFEPGSPVTPAQAAQIWNAASERFAKAAIGEVNVFSTGAKKMGPWGMRTWWKIEQPLLKKNPNVTKITRRKKHGTPCKQLRSGRK